jgi:formylglycine-generating enzyme required for sulfatase activity
MKRIMRNILKTFFIGMIALSIISSCEDETTNNSNNTPDSLQIEEPVMVQVEGGTFIMGCTAEQGEDCRDNELPAHSVTLNSFKISKYEITQKQYESVMGTNPSNNANGDNYPVENISWDDAQEYCRRLSDSTGKQYRLPTEAEWEYAARGGNQSQGYKYSGSNNLNSVGWYYDNSGSNSSTVGQKSPNELGIYDMSGNVWEWCSDWYGAYSAEVQTNPTGPSSGSHKVRRGGGWDGGAASCRVAIRDYGISNGGNDIVGFRVVCP